VARRYRLERQLDRVVRVFLRRNANCGRIGTWEIDINETYSTSIRPITK
jgi:hypothetical protein